MDRYAVDLEHEELLVRRGPRSGAFCIVAVHSTVLGPAVGGCRMWRYGDRRAAVRDALALSRAMTYKSATAGLGMGGGKGVIALTGPAPSGRARRELLLDFGETVDVLRGRYKTAADVGTSVADMSAIAKATRHVTGLPRRRGGSGDPSPWTAVGVEAAILASCERAFGSPSLRGRSVAIVGLGHVGLPLARLLARRGAKLVCADIAAARREDARALGARWMTPAKALRAGVDVLAPCALGGVLDESTIAELQAPVIAGAANNQLADESLARVLHDRGVLWAPDFVANAGGIINISVELRRGGYDPSVARAKVRAIAATVTTIFADTSRTRTPLAAAQALARTNLAAAGA